MLLTLLLLAAQPNCADAQTQTAMNICAGQDYARADAAMTAQWKRTYAAMKQRDSADTSRGGGFGYAAALLNAQRAWLKFRDAECVIEGGEFAGGSLQGMAQAQCRTQVTQARTRQLKALIWQH
jgi:uncharacterized protein YecT (DUF1311 family)